VFFPADLWFRSFLLTVSVELPIVAYSLRAYEPSRIRLVLLIVFANLASHPAVWFIFTQVFLFYTPEYLVAAESWAVGIEALFYWVAFRGVSARRAIIVSLAANAASFALAEVLARMWPALLTR
jgi:hypothetical protein